jgi:aryl-alcohol dehydrogenase-like predicted oxidoreductase
MKTVTLGKTGITVQKNGFGALPVQRVDVDAAVFLLRKALSRGITFFDTARFYTDSEHKVGTAFAGMRDKVIIATKTMCATPEDFYAQLAASLEKLQTDYIDVYQFHNPPSVPKPGDGSGLYEAMLDAKAQGKIRHIGITNHKLPLAIEAARSGLYETIQFPFNYLSSPQEEDFVRLCAQENVGVIAMKALSGGLITNSAAAYAYLDQFDNVVPIWGVQRETELDEFLSYIENPPVLDEAAKRTIEADRASLGGEFCRGCGYCLPCPAGIEIPTSARMSLLIRRAPLALYMTAEWDAKMALIDKCVACGHCVAHCPYGLDTPRLLRENYADYKAMRQAQNTQ